MIAREDGVRQALLRLLDGLFGFHHSVVEIGHCVVSFG
jgi:hypothetical protein